MGGAGRLALLTLVVTLGLSVSASAQSGALPPSNSSPPTISGTPRDALTLTSTNGTWSGALNTFTRQWQRCDGAGGSCVAISGATQTSYVLTADDVGFTIRVRVTASSLLGSNSASSSQTAIVAPAPPVNQALPSLSGMTRDTQTLSVSAGAWSGTPPLSFSYRWRRCDAAGAGCADIALQTATTYILTSADVGKTIRAVVTATNAAGSVFATSQATSVVAADPPANTVLPAVSGAFEEGRDLTIDRGTWTGTPPLAYAYQWQRCSAVGGCSAIAGATATSYTLVAGDVGLRVAVDVSATNGGGSIVARSTQTELIAAGKPFVRSAPSISGTARDGEMRLSEGDRR